MIPRLHLVTDDGILARGDFISRAEELLALGRGAIALHLRGPGTPGRALYELGAVLAARAAQSGSLLLVNDRLDVALALGIAGLHLGQRSVPVRVARALMGPEAILGLSVHGAREAGGEASQGVDFLLAGTIFATAAHPEREPGGLERIREVRGVSRLPVLAIGGVTPARVGEVMGAGAHGVAVRGGVWEAGDPGRALGVYLKELEGAPS